MRKNGFIGIALFLVGCSDGEPLNMSRGYREYIGVWQHRDELKTESLTKVDNLLLAINGDGSAVFRKCQFDESKTENSTNSSSISVSLPSSFVAEVTSEKITLIQKVAWFGFKKELKVDKKPYSENGNRYIGIEGKSLTLLSQEKVNSETNWACPSDNEKT